jgi:hypothetical protein
MANPQLDAIRDEVAALRRLRFEELGTTSIPIYAGDIENLGIYLDRFDVISVAYGWTEEEKCQRFPLYLRDHALDVYRAITQARRAVFNDMLTDFRNGISTTDAPKMFGCQLRARKQRHDESSAMFASKLKKLARQAYPALTEAQLDPLLRDCFIFGLQSNLQNRLLDKDINTFADAIKLATNLEMRLKYIQPTDCYTAATTMDRPATSNTNMELLQLRTELDNLKKSMMTIRNQPIPQRTQLNHTAQPYCPNCKRYGHTEPACFYRQGKNIGNRPFRPWQNRNQRGMENHKDQQQQVRFQNLNDPRIPRWSKSPDPHGQNSNRYQNQREKLGKPSNSNFKQSYATQRNLEIPSENFITNDEGDTSSLYVTHLETEVEELNTQLRRLNTENSQEWSNAILKSASITQKEIATPENNNYAPKVSNNKVSISEEPRKNIVRNTPRKNKSKKNEQPQNTYRGKSSNITPLLCMCFCFCFITDIPVAAIRGFDCSQPAISDQISLVDIEVCADATPTKLKQTNRTYHVYQETITNKVMVTECRMQTSELIFHCGTRHHSSIKDAQIMPIDTPPSVVQCIQAKDYGLIGIDNKRTIPAHVNRTTLSKLFLVGVTYEDGKCKGGELVINGVTWQDMIHYKEFSVTVTSYMAQFDTSTGAMLTHGYNFCKLSDGRCHTGQSQLIYQTPSETCDLVLLKTTMFYEIQGERPRYTAPTALSLPAYTDEQNSTRVENMEYEHTPMVLMTPGNQDTLRFVRKGVLRKCNHQVFSTNYDHLFVSTDQVPTAKRSIEATDIKLTQFVTNKMDYLYHSNLALIEDIYRDTILRDCQIKRELLRTQLAFASANPDAATPLLSTHLGIFGRVTGEALFIFKCTPVEVTPRNSTDCTNQLAVTYDKRKVYLEPISRIIVNTPTIIECSTITPPRFKMTDNLWLTVPYRIRTETPRTLSVNWPEKEFRFQSLNELSSSGIYSKEDLEKARKHIFFPQTRSRIITEIVQRTTQHYDSFPNYGMLITPDAIYGAASGFLSNLWNRFMWFGQVASGFLGLWILCTLIKSVSSRVISGYELYKILGWSWKMCSCIFPFIAKLLIDKRRDRQVHKLAKTVEELETHVDKENQDICCEVGAQHEEPSAPLTQNQSSKEASSSSEVKSLTPPAYPVLYPRLHQATDLPWMEPWWYSYKPPTQRSSLDEQPSRIPLYPSINFMVYYSEDSAPLMDIRVNGSTYQPRSYLRT